jgi:hypothetical protein
MHKANKIDGKEIALWTAAIGLSLLLLCAIHDKVHAETLYLHSDDPVAYAIGGRNNPVAYAIGGRNNFTKEGCEEAKRRYEARFADDVSPNGDKFLQTYHKGNTFTCEK